MVTVLPPIRRSALTKPLATALSTGEDLGAIGSCGGVMEWHGTVGGAVDELADECILRRPNFGGGSLRDDPPFRNEVEVIDDLERFVDVVRHDQRGDAERIAQAP